MKASLKFDAGRGSAPARTGLDAARRFNVARVVGQKIAQRNPNALNGDLFCLAGLFDALDDTLVWIKDREGRYLWVNKAFQVRYGLEHCVADGGAAETAILGKTDHDLSPAFLADQFRIDDEIVLSGKRIVDRIERVGQWNGPIQWNVTNKAPVLDEKGRIIGTAGITRPFSNPVAEVTREAPFNSVLEHIRANFHGPLTNQELAAVSKMSLRAFERQFQASFHLTPQRYVRRVRLGIASRALIYGSETLAEVALNCGFGDQSHFTREFRRQFGRTPREYRAHYKSGAAVFRTKIAGPKQ